MFLDMTLVLLGNVLNVCGFSSTNQRCRRPICAEYGGAGSCVKWRTHISKAKRRKRELRRRAAHSSSFLPLFFQYCAQRNFSSSLFTIRLCDFKRNMIARIQENWWLFAQQQFLLRSSKFSTRYVPFPLNLSSNDYLLSRKDSFNDLLYSSWTSCIRFSA